MNAVLSRCKQAVAVGEQLRGHVSVMAHDEAGGITAALCQNSGARDVESVHMSAIHGALAEVFRKAGA